MNTILSQHQTHRARPTGNANPRCRLLYVEPVEQRMLLAFAVSDAVMLPATPDPPVAAAQVEITFNEPIDRGSLSASDLLFNGAPAAAVSTRGETRAVFELPAVEGAGPHVVTIAAGVVRQADQQGTPVEPFRAEFRLDAPERWMVHHPPRLQLGDAPLFPFGSSQSDQVEILWQTLPAGEGDHDQFTVEYRSAEVNVAWRAVDVNATLDTGVEGRLIHSASIMGLGYDQAYEYRVRQLRDNVVVDAYQSTFRTRLPVSHSGAFSFAAYGDSASVSANDHFRTVQDRINRSSADFALLLGDNFYEIGLHREADARFSTKFSPEATEWAASHIDYFTIGNHDVAFANGQSSRDNFSVPVPRAGINAHAEPPASEPPEFNYSFDYGNTHFATFDTNSLDDPERLDSQLAWLEQDLTASDAAWKIVFGHHPVAFVPDKRESPGGNYYRQVVPRLHAAGVHLFMVGHSHTYSRTKPLLGEVDGVATFIDDTDNRYDKGAGLVQVVAGTGGAFLRSGDYAGPGMEAVAAGFSRTTTPPAANGFALVDVTPTELSVRYVAADDGRVLDTFSIVAEPQALTGRITEIVPNPRRQTVEQITVEFSGPVTGFGLSDLILSRDGIETLLPANIVLQSRDNRVWTLAPLGTVTDRPGRYELSIAANGSGIQALAGNQLQDDVFASWTDVREPGDTNGDGMFDQRDIVSVLSLNRFRKSASWHEGDWNGDGIFDSHDLELALGQGRYRPQ